jgi:hypothetical protein
MAESTANLTYELLKKVQERLGQMDHKIDEIKVEIQAMRGNLVSLQQDVHNIYTILSRHDMQLDRIERRLELSDAPQL